VTTVIDDTDETLLRVDKLTCGYGGGPVLWNLGLELVAGEAVGIFGANGAGKSTLLRAVSGLVPAPRRSIQWQGRDITRLPAYQRARLGITHVPEGRGIFPDLTVRENLLLGLMGRDPHASCLLNEKDRLASILTIFPAIRDRLRQRAGTLSGGQQQMLAVGRGLMSEPKLLVLDEPSLGLSPLAVTELFESLVALRNGGVPILIVEQNVVSALSLIDRAYLLTHGYLSGGGPAAEVMTEERIREAYFGTNGGASAETKLT